MVTTHEEIWAMLRELIASQQDTDRKFQDTERLLKQQSQDTERLLKQQSQDTERKFQDTERLLKQQSQDTERKFQDTERLLKQQSQDTDRKIKEVANQIGRLGNRLGDFVEEMVRPALVRLFQDRGIDVHQVLQNLTAYDNQRRMISEVDLLVVDNAIAIAVECKSQLSTDDVNDHLKRLELFKSCFPQYANFQILGAVASMVLPDNVGQYAIRKGLYILAQSGEAITIQNDVAFQPREW